MPINQLMDREWPEAQRAAFLAAAAEYPELDGLHDLRTRTSGSHHFVQFHVWVPGDWTVREAHDRLDAVEEALQARFPGTEILIHLDPARPHRPRDHAAQPSDRERPMTDLPFFQVDAFADRPFEGNPAAVMPLDEWLPDEVMQAIAAENNLSRDRLHRAERERRGRLRPALVHPDGRGRSVRPCHARQRRMSC